MAWLYTVWILTAAGCFSLYTQYQGRHTHTLKKEALEECKVDVRAMFGAGLPEILFAVNSNTPNPLLIFNARLATLIVFGFSDIAQSSRSIPSVGNVVIGQFILFPYCHIRARFEMLVVSGFFGSRNIKPRLLEFTR